ncbi:MAG TPA: manganese-binding transcriptional regulator MntR [Phycisphaerae bacterium]|nr:manganese-binding transcriptional regulator MntR [Phycisphaerales bacterium]HNO80592.1 manganese-binding transcriptional regulator MntR [Phycisphaerae bacterium]
MSKSETKTSSAKNSVVAKARFARIRNDHAKELAEDYLEMIDDLTSANGEARAVDIAAQLGVSHVTVTKAVARLKRDGLVTSQPYRSIFLTPKGKRIADNARRRHQTVLQFLLALGVPADSAEIDAEGIEHHISPATLKAMRDFTEENG